MRQAGTYVLDTVDLIADVRRTLLEYTVKRRDVYYNPKIYSYVSRMPVKARW